MMGIFGWMLNLANTIYTYLDSTHPVTILLVYFILYFCVGVLWQDWNTCLCQSKLRDYTLTLNLDMGRSNTSTPLILKERGEKGKEDTKGGLKPHQ